MMKPIKLERMMAMTLERLRYFVAAAELLNFTRAAEQCHIAQTAMSRQIAMLEEELGCRLFQREHRAVTLTESGQVFYKGASAILKTYQETVERTRASARGLTGTLHIGIGQYERRFVSTLVEEFHQHMPDVVVTISQYGYNELINRMLNGLLDMIFALPVSAGYLAGEKVDIHELFTVSSGVIMRKGDPLAGRTSIFAQDLSDRTVITTSEAEGPCSLAVYRARAAHYGYSFRKIVQANSLPAALLMIQAGMGLMLVPMLLEDELPHDLAIVPMDAALYPLEKFVAIHRTDCQNPTLRVFMEGVLTSQTLYKQLEQLHPRKE